VQQTEVDCEPPGPLNGGEDCVFCHPPRTRVVDIFTEGGCQCESVGGYCNAPDIWSLCGDCCVVGGTSGPCIISPIIIDVQGNGFNLTDANGGVDFDMTNDGIPERTAWTAPGVDEAFLVLDRNGNNNIDNGSELFGNFTPQSQPPPQTEKNGFNALMLYDKISMGGDDDGSITFDDAIWTSLRLWRDANHNGISESNELSTLVSNNLKELRLNYKLSKKTDQFGNVFKYRAKVKDTHDSNVGKWAWDVFLVTQ